MRRSLVIAAVAFSLVASLAGCGKKAEQAGQATTSADSLLSSNPTEQPAGNLTPEQNYQQPGTQQPPAAAPVTPPPTSKPKSTPKPTPKPAPAEAPGITVPAGTAFHVAFSTHVTSETAQPGDSWTGTLKESVSLGSEGSIPAGSTVRGVVVAARPAERGDRAMLLLEMTSVDYGGKSFEASGRSDTLIAGSTRARNVGAVAGGTAAGALIGRAIGGGGKGALIGGLIGGAAATGAVAKSKGYQVEMKEGAEMTFTLTKNAKVRL